MKAIGLFDAGHNPPAWARVCTLSDLDPPHVWAEAIALSRARGVTWWLKIGYHEDPRTPIGPHAARVRARLDEYGLLPYVVGMTVLVEEAYGYWQAGEWARFGLPAGYPGGARIIRDWMSYQHGQAKRQIPVPIVWLTTAATASDGPMPIPANTDAVALDPYAPPGGTFDAHIAPILRLAESVTALPLVLVAQWFDAPGFAPAAPAHVARYLEWLERPRWIALVGFTWQDRAALDMRGLASLTAVRAALEAALTSDRFRALVAG